MELKEFKFSIELAEVQNKTMRKIKESIEVVSHIYHSVKCYSETDYIPLEVNNLPLSIEDKTSGEDNVSIKDKTYNWVFKKAFEEFIVGLTESLMEAYRFAKYREMAMNTKFNPFDSVELIRKKIAEIDRKAMDIHFPNLITEIEKSLGVNMVLKDQILSVNKLRNCLVHRNGVVGEKDIDENGKLVLKYLELGVYTKNENGEMQITWDIKKDGVYMQNIGFRENSKTLEFLKGVKIELDQNTFNNVAYTCVFFVMNLFQALPKQNINSQ